ncbi:MAG: hypothetical protein ACM3PF_04240 [Bacteroidota bacterium]
MKTELSLTPVPFAIALVAIGIAVAVWAYATRYPVLEPRRRAILLVARLLSLVALLVASLAPVARFPTTSRERNRLLVLVDHSGSMEVRDAPGGRSRAEASDSAAAALANELGRRYDVRVAPFDASLGPFTRGPESLREPGASVARAGETALGDALREAVTRVDPDSVAAIVVLSDGAVNRGEDPERALDASLPAFALTAGSATDPPTVGIASVESPSDAVLGRPAPVQVTVRQGRRPATSGMVRLGEGGRELAKAPYALTGPGASIRATLSWTPLAAGRHFLAVTLDAVPGDPMRENKSRLIGVDVRPAKRFVPVLASAWDWDLRALARGVESDTAWAAQRITPAGSADAANPDGAIAPLAARLENAEAAVVRFDAHTATPERQAQLLRYVERGGGLLLWIDPDGRMPSDSPLTQALGLSWGFWGRDPGLEAADDLTPAGRVHEVTLLEGDASSAASTWRDLPPVKPPVFLRVRGSALAPILGTHVDGQQVPLVLAGHVGLGRVIVLNAAGVYRWGLTASGLGNGAGVEATFFGGAARWLAAAKEDRPVRITAPDITPEGRSMAVRVTTSAPLGPGAVASVRARRIGPTGLPTGEAVSRNGVPAASGAASLTLAEPGVYTGSLAAAPGVYVLVGRVDQGGRLVGMDSTRVAVGAQGIEFESLAAEPDVLARLAERSGGAAAPLSSPEPVLKRLRSPDLVRSRLAQVDLFHNPLLFAILVLGLAVEWALRRRFHLM